MAIEWDNHEFKVLEVARQFLPSVWLGEDDVHPIPWTSRHHGPPDLTKPPPTINGHQMRWVTREVTYSEWKVVPADE